MKTKQELMELMEKARADLDRSVLEDPYEVVCEKSRYMDVLIEEYLDMEKKTEYA